MNQRWRDGRSQYRPHGETINTMRYEVEYLAGDKLAKQFIETHHYSGSFPAARFRFGLRRGEDLVGVAVFSVPCNNAVLTNVFPVDVATTTELGRFVLLDDVPGNGETWFLGRCFEQIGQMGIVGVISHSDPLVRQTLAGDVVMPGHVGTIYQAHNGVYLGRCKPRPVYLLPDGTVFNERVLQKVRAGHRGWESGAEQLQVHGAEKPGKDLREWVDHWVKILCRKIRHKGNHKYAWPVNRRMRKHLPESKAYPKEPDFALA